jgi:hypothetical protein
MRCKAALGRENDEPAGLVRNACYRAYALGEFIFVHLLVYIR